MSTLPDSYLYNRLGCSVVAIKQPNNKGSISYRLKQYRMMENYTEQNKLSGLPFIHLLFNGDASSPVELKLLASDARRIGEALIAAANNVEPRYFAKAVTEWEAQQGAEGIQPDPKDLYEAKK